MFRVLGPARNFSYSKLKISFNHLLGKKAGRMEVFFYNPARLFWSAHLLGTSKHGLLGLSNCSSISAQTNQEGIKCTKAKEYHYEKKFTKLV